MELILTAGSSHLDLIMSHISDMLRYVRSKDISQKTSFCGSLSLGQALSPYPTGASWGEPFCQGAEKKQLLHRTRTICSSTTTISTTMTTKGFQPVCEQRNSECFFMRTTAASKLFLSQNWTFQNMSTPTTPHSPNANQSMLRNDGHYVMVLKPFWSRSISSSTPLFRPTPTNATCKDPGHHTLIFVICNCILHNVNDCTVVCYT